jgi:hypothetical protein
MGVRMLGLPYQFYWEKKDRFTNAWETYRYDFALPRIKRGVAFFLVARPPNIRSGKSSNGLRPIRRGT